MEKIYHKNTIRDLLEFKPKMIDEWRNGDSKIEANIASIKTAEEWRKLKPHTEKQFIKFYQNSKNYLKAIAFYNQTARKLRLIEKMLKVIKSLSNVKKIVDYGCGVLSDSLFLSSLGYKVAAMEIDSKIFKFAEYRLNKYQMKSLSLTEIKNEGENCPKCDLILCLDVLEHVYDPYKVLNNFFKTKCKYILMSIAFKAHNEDQGGIPYHTNYSIAKIEKYIEENGYKKQKLNVLYPPRLYIRQ